MHAYVYDFCCVLKVHTGNSRRCVGIVGDAVDALASSKAAHRQVTQAEMEMSG